MTPEDPEDEAAWRRYCLSMAEATYALADRSEDLSIMRAYLDLAARWLSLADDPRPFLGDDDAAPT